MNKIMISHDDFEVCRAALTQAELYWQAALDIDVKNIPGDFTEEEVRHILDRIVAARKKIEDILLMQPIVDDDKLPYETTLEMPDDHKKTIH